MLEILFTKKSQKLCGRSADGIEDGSDEVFDLPRRVFVMLNDCLDEVHARILVLKNVDLACCTILLTSLQAERKICLCTSRSDFNHCLCSPPLALGLGKLRTDGTEPGRKGAVGNLALSGRGVLIQEVLQ